MSLALDGSVGHALNPLTWIQVMSRFGLPYLLLIGVQCLIALIVGVAQMAFDPHSRGDLIAAGLVYATTPPCSTFT